MGQGSLFIPDDYTGDAKPAVPMVARAANADPVTSFIAAEQVEKSGKANLQRQIVLAWVRQHPGQTAAEIAHHTGLERHVPSRRLPELREAGLVSNGSPRICGVCGTRQMTWGATA